MTADTAATIPVPPRSPGWLVDRKFDLMFIFGTALLSLGLGVVAAVAVPQLFIPVLILNLWLLGYHHVLATFTRLCFDKESHRQSWALLYIAGPAMLLFVIGVWQFVGIWLLTSIYLYAQWFHYARQSWGVSRGYERSAGTGFHDRSWLTQAVFYGAPLLGILRWSYLSPETFLSMPLKTLPVTQEMYYAGAAVMAVLVVVWLVRMAGQWREGVLPRAYVCFMGTHFAVFGIGYLMMPTLESAWLVVNIWHNLQYIMFVWAYNNRRYRGGPDPEAKVLSVISQKKNWAIYVMVTLMLTLLVYGGLNMFMKTFLVTVPLFIAYQAINYHHYIVDAVIWRQSWIKRGRAAAKPPVAAE